MGPLGITFCVIALIVMLISYKDLTAHNKAVKAAKLAGQETPKMDNRLKGLQIVTLLCYAAGGICFFMAAQALK